MPPLLFHLLLLLTIPFTLAQSSIFGTEIVENLAFNSPVKNLPQYAVTPPNLEKFVRRQYGFKYRVAPPTTQKPGPKNGTTVTNPSPVQEGQFLHGVASGDPLSDAIILWTKVTTPQPTIPITYQLSLSPNFTTIHKTATVLTTAEISHTIKVDITNLDPATTYYYRFLIPNSNTTSPTGRTHTLPSQTADIKKYKLAVVSCSNYPQGFFNAYNGIANRPDIDLVVGLGDYIYEYGNKEYGDGTSIGRIPSPNKEITTLEDYRSRHAQYKTDPDLQRAHAAHPWIVVWDDHESADNSSPDGAGNHQPDEGPWSDRKLAAMRAYFEYMPIRAAVVDGEGRIYRSFGVGGLLDLVMLDTRMGKGGRKQGLTRRQNGESFLGYEQESWLQTTLLASSSRGAKWRILGNQVTFSPIKILGIPISKDSWDGYPESRSRLLNQLQTNNITNVCIITGDIHTALAFNVPSVSPWNILKFKPWSGEGSQVVEFVGTSVTSPGAGKVLTGGLLASQPHLKYGNGVDHGYMVVSVMEDKVVTEYVVVERIDRRGVGERVDAVVETGAGTGRITKVVRP